ncbi:hypothetical protein SAMN05216228_101384 [Rhizobium tibeticum]|uniref:Uncharacterized protein n=2 Tax=Rhizobium tibeticum TaxID=501024 RepID=A0A1H8MVL0_9HYPH|nr:hypothetical protein RTCCBAU85039_4402 [Rhizobium tibeticum]SEO21300.1 hypothetical protein SAMN05216228_101384 [Rhizobium tibeticum]
MAQGFVSAPVVADKAVVPAAVETQVKKKFSLLGWIGGLGTGLSTGLGFLGGMDWRTILAIGGFDIGRVLAGAVAAALDHRGREGHPRGRRGLGRWKGMWLLFRRTFLKCVQLPMTSSVGS